MPVLLKHKESAPKNVIIRYREMNGIKLTVFLPLIHSQIKHAILEQAKAAASDEGGSERLIGSLVLTHS